MRRGWEVVLAVSGVAIVVLLAVMCATLCKCCTNSLNSAPAHHLDRLPATDLEQQDLLAKCATQKSSGKMCHV